ncbi:MAG: hypothetical protein ABH837_03775 [bacterium]
MDWKKSFSWILVIILLITNGIMGYYFYQLKNELDDRTTTILEYEEGTRTSGDPDSSSDSGNIDLNKYWQRVTLKDVYSFEYPAEWYMSDSQDRTLLGFWGSFKNADAGEAGIGATGYVRFRLIEEEVISEEGFNNYIESYKNDNCSNISEEQDLTINAAKAKKIACTIPEDGYLGGGKIVVYFIYDASDKGKIGIFDNTVLTEPEDYDSILLNLDKVTNSLEWI